MCEDSGAAYITVHGRTRSDFYAGKADWNKIAEVKSAVKIPVIGNGDVFDGCSAKAMMEETGVDGVMVGRATLGAPWLIAQIDNYLKNGVEPQQPGVKEIERVLLTHIKGLREYYAHIKGLREYYGDRTALALSRKYVCWYCKGLHDAKKFREQYVRTKDFESAYKVIDSFFAGECGRCE